MGAHHTLLRGIKMKKSKKLLIVMTTVFTLTCIGATTAFAGNTEGSAWKFDMYERVEITSARDKYNDSSAWGEVVYGGIYDGKVRETNFQIIDENEQPIRDYQGYDKSRTCTVSGDSGRQVINFANEYGYSRVKMKIWRSIGEVGGRGGFWRADTK